MTKKVKLKEKRKDWVTKQFKGGKQLKGSLNDSDTVPILPLMEVDESIREESTPSINSATSIKRKSVSFGEDSVVLFDNRYASRSVTERKMKKAESRRLRRRKGKV